METDRNHGLREEQMKPSLNCWVLVESPRGKILRESLEAVTAALSFGRQDRIELTALWTGAKPDETQQGQLERLEVKKVILLDEPEHGPAAGGSYTLQEDLLLSTVRELYLQHRPHYVFFGSTPLSRSLAPKLAALLEVGYAAGVTYLRQVGDILQMTRPALQDRLSEILVFASPENGLVSLYRRSFSITSQPIRSRGERKLEIDTVPLNAGENPNAKCVLVNRETEPPGFLDVEDAEIVVAGGKGMGSGESFRMLQELAGLLGGAVAASRIAVDLGWVGKDRLVGQTGRKISPELYIACGISGAPQHRVGIKDARYILAINKDPKAPIFKSATWGIQGDCLKVVPEMIRLMGQSQGTGRSRAF